VISLHTVAATVYDYSRFESRAGRVASDGTQTQGSLPSTYNLPSPEIPRTIGYPVNPPPGTPVIIQPVEGGTGTEAIFPYGAPAGSVGEPFEVPIDFIP
jgi:hypothetical protein